METIRNAANSAVNTASGYIYGNQTTEAGTEPVSGQTGAGTVNEPYDKGNETVHSTNPTTETSSTGPTTTGTTGTGVTHDTAASGTTGPTTTHEGPGAPGSEQLRTNVTGVQDESNVASSGSLHDQYVTGNKRYRGGKQASYYNPPTDSATTNPSHGSKIGGPDPASGADPASGQKPMQKQQGGDRPTDEPTGGEKEAVVDDKERGEEALKKKDPNDHSGEPMHMHDGKEKKEEKEEGGEHPGQEGGGKHGESGSGEKWVKTSGLQAEGGDFDAAQAGAGREADRLLEEKGIVKDERGAMVDKEGNPVHPEPVDNKSASASGGSKGSKLASLKEKLHIGTGKKL